MLNMEIDTTPSSGHNEIMIERLIKQWYPFSPMPYRPDPTKCWRVGHHTFAKSTTEPITEEEAEKELTTHVDTLIFHISQIVRVPLTPNQMQALVGFTFLTSKAALELSTLLRLLNRGWYSSVPASLRRWSDTIPHFALEDIITLWKEPNQ